MATGCMAMEGMAGSCGMKLSGCGKFWMQIMQVELGPGQGTEQGPGLAQVQEQGMRDHSHSAAQASVQHKQTEQRAKEPIYTEEGSIGGGIISISSTMSSTSQTILRYQAYVLSLRIYWIL